MAVPPPSAPPCPPGEEFELHFIGELELLGLIRQPCIVAKTTWSAFETVRDLRKVWLGISRTRLAVVLRILFALRFKMLLDGVGLGVCWGVCATGLSSDDGLFIDYAAEAGSDWLPIARKEGFVGQTQTAYADPDGVQLG